MRRYDLAQLIACIIVLLCESELAILAGVLAGLLYRLFIFHC